MHGVIDRRPPLRALTLLFLRIVNLTFGGGDPTMAALQRELVERRGWLAAEKYGLSYGLARVTPGTNLLAFCAATAWLLRGWRGALLALVAATVPSAVLVVWLSYAYQVLTANHYGAGAIGGMLAAAVGMMIAAAWNLARPHVRSRTWPRTLVLVAGSLALSLGLGMPPIQVLALAALAGLLWRGAPSQ